MESVELVKLQEMVDSILKKIDTISVPQPKQQNHSLDRNELFAALSKAQGSMRTVGANKENPYYQSRYADLDAIIAGARRPLSDNGLSVMQKIISNDGQHMLISILGHASGQWDSSTIQLNPPQSDTETFGSYLSAMKRNAYAALIGIASSEEDDDGEISMADERKKVTTPPKSKLKMERESYETITVEQREELEYELQRHPNPESLVESLYRAYSIRSLAGIPKSKFLTVITKVREVINAEEKARK